MATLVLGSGIVGTAAAWDLVRRGHDVAVADADIDTARTAAAISGADATLIDADHTAGLLKELDRFEIVVSAIPYRFGLSVATAALTTGTHYLDFGGNPTIVASQKHLHDQAVDAGVMIVPDCGLAPGLANVLAEDLIASSSDGDIDSIQLRVGALPQEPVGAFGYQLAFSPEGLINEYAEPCETIRDGEYTIVEPLTRFEDVDWERWGPLEAFSTAGGTSTMPICHVGRVRSLEYKTLRYPGHGHIFRSLLEMGMFDEPKRIIGSVAVSPRAVLLEALNRTMPRGAPDVVLVRVWRDQNGTRTTRQITDVAQGGFSALARTTAFPATALADLIARGSVDRPGVFTMSEAVPGSGLLPELFEVGIEVAMEVEVL
ncbi:MAG: saccharopine dehydrogenase NADP-binding domain-containing protein [Actinomycetia bacterium]|nr:saccharopine dehydrogenase NADP-binding domain-containing protein [Actinomycetes bacterium]